MSGISTRADNITVVPRGMCRRISAVRPCIFLLSALALAPSLVTSSAAIGQTVLQVNSTGDQIDVDTSDPNCQTIQGTCTLRAAVMQANHLTNLGAVIMVPAGNYVLGSPVDTDDDKSGDLNLLDPPGVQPGPTTIIGAGSALTIIDGHGTDRVFNISSARNISISKVSIINGLVASGSGGGINSPIGNLALSDCVLSNNTANGSKGDGYGGGVNAGGNVTINRCTFDGNQSSVGGGGIYNFGTLIVGQSVFSANVSSTGGGIESAGTGHLWATQVTFTANVARVEGGAVINFSDPSELSLSSATGNISTAGGGGVENFGNLTINRTTIAGNTGGTGAGIRNSQGNLYIVNSTITSNQAVVDGGGIVNFATVNVYNSTIAFNEADSDADTVGDGAGVYNIAGATFNIRNTILAGNYVAGEQAYRDCIGTVGMYGSNRVSSVCVAAAGSQGYATVIGSPYELGTLQDNGGPTQTMAILPPSDMIAGGFQCWDFNGQPLTTDQRGRPRPPGSTCDIGAFEFNELFRSGFEP